MFEREIKFIYDFNLNKVKKAGAFLTFEQLLAADLHPAIMQYISAEIDYLIFEDRQKMLKNSAFDYSGGKITQYFNLINQEVKKSKRFSSDYIYKLILHASSFTVNFLIRPKWSLLKFIFDDDENKTAAEIKQILNYLYYYGYLKNILISYLDKKKILSMTRDEFADLLEKIEKLGIETYLDDVLNTALKSMAEFFNIGSTQKTKVPLPGINVFLKEKKLAEHINILNENFGADEKLNQEIADIQKVLLSVKVHKEDIFEELREEDIEKKESRLDDEVVETQEESEKDFNYSEDYKSNSDIINDESDDYDTEEVNVTEFNVDEEKTNSEEEIEKNLSLQDLMETDGGKSEDINEDKVERSKFSTLVDFEEKEDVENEIEEVQEEIISEMSAIDKETDLKEEFAEGIEAEPELNEYEETQSIEELLEEEIEEKIEVEVVDNINEEIETEQETDNIYDEELDKKDDDEIIEQRIISNDNEELEDEVEDDISETDDINDEYDEPSLFKEEDFKDNDSDDEDILAKQEPIPNKSESVGPTSIDMSEILENKNMTKIIENIFDYDMEDFANTIDLISECQTKGEALALLNDLFENNNIKATSKEAEKFKSIISEYFDKV